MSLEHFFRSFRRFVSRRGLPKRVVSDNTKTFKGAATIFKEIMKQRDDLEGSKIQWTFNVERAPWWGGVFERLIRSVKRCLRKVIGRAKLSFDELLTVVTEAEMIVNSRPLSYVTSEDLDEPITPSHLLIGRRILSVPDNLCYSDDDETYEVNTSSTNQKNEVYWPYIRSLLGKMEIRIFVGAKRSTPLWYQIIQWRNDYSRRYCGHTL